jgi:hypothetical protein
MFGCEIMQPGFDQMSALNAQHGNRSGKLTPVIAPLVFAGGRAATHRARLLVKPFGRITVPELADHKCGQKRRAGFGILDHGCLKRLISIANFCKTKKCTICGHDYAATAANCLNADIPFVAN